jgi:competence protein ComEC
MTDATAPAAGRFIAAARAAGPSWVARGAARLLAVFVDQRDRWALWIPVLFGAGIAAYFAVRFEPPPWTGAAAVAPCLAAALCARRRPALRLAVLAAVLIAAGFATAQWRTHAVAAPVLARDFGPGWVSGRVVAVEKLPEGARVLLDRPGLEGIAAAATPARVRLRLRRGDDADVGAFIRLRAKLSPPAAPAMPGAYDFQRHAWFAGIGGVGFAFTHAAAMPAPPGAEASGAAVWLARLRLAVADRIRAAIPGTAGAVAAALLVGDRSAIPEEAIDAMRDSGLAHLLAISGLHVGLVAGTLFFGIRLLLALIEPAALRLPVKKIAAACAFAGALLYLFMAGATVPTQRAFIMTGLVLTAVMVDRTAITLRLVAWAAMIVLLLAPESLTGPSFQMSFAAVLALVAAYEGMRQPWRQWRAGSGWGRRIGLYLAALALSTLIAGTATGIIALHHFGRYSQYSLVANLIAIPLAGFWIMPWGVLACLLMPFGLEQLALTPMAWGIDLMLGAARTVASWPGASLLVPAMPAEGLVLAALGGLWICLWRGRLRWGGVIGVAAGLATIPLADRPDVLVNGDGRLMAVRMADGRYSLSTTRRETFAARIWLERDGDAETEARAWPETESADGRLACDALGCVYRAGRRPRTPMVALVQDPRALLDDCTSGAVVVSAVPVRRHCRAAARVIDRFDLWRDGAHALWLKDDGRLEVLSVRQARGDRPWTRSPPAAHGPPRRAVPAENKKPLSTAASARRGGPAP